MKVILGIHISHSHVILKEMKGRIERIKQIILGGALELGSIEAIQLLHQPDEDIYDPYFILSFDIYFKGGIPLNRKDLYKDAELYESSTQRNKDRVLIDNLPVRLEYRDLELVDRQIEAVKRKGEFHYREMSYLFNRIVRGESLLDSRGWLIKAQKIIENLDEDFWSGLRDFYCLKMEHHLSDVKAAAFNEDPFFYHLAMGNFLRHCGALLLAINKKTEPSPRYIDRQIRKLSILPSGFLANYESLLRNDEELTLERKSEVAALFARSIIGLLSV